MKPKDIHSGDLVAIGTPKQLKEGRAIPAVVIAFGWREVRDGSGIHPRCIGYAKGTNVLVAYKGFAGWWVPDIVPPARVHPFESHKKAVDLVNSELDKRMHDKQRAEAVVSLLNKTWPSSATVETKFDGKTLLTPTVSISLDTAELIVDIIYKKGLV